MNRLAREKSPYLLQHQHNPVDWHAWSDDAFARARAEHKPIFLSIGYSTCHWCHVMERESFEDPKIAEYLNAHFISIKVDREERPDVDKIYMTFVQASSGQGGWPLSAFLLPDLKPFYGGTYFPPTSRHGRPGFLEVLQRIQQLWQARPADLEQSAADLHRQLEGFCLRTPSPEVALSPAPIVQATALALAEYDPQHGGFGSAPKFPRPALPALVLRQAVRTGDERALRSVLHTCAAMAAGGLRDQLGGGFHRYAVDAEWRVPHFEKMLYDNAQLVQLYLDAYLVSGEAAHAEVVRDVLRYVVRDMTDEAGAFYSAEDADSEGQEGKFYCWTRQELESLLSPEEFGVATRYFGITAQGNFVDHSHPEPLPGLNVLHLADALERADDRPLLSAARAKMFEARSRRVRPNRDDKILASWNGLMLGAMARAGAVLSEPGWLAAAQRNLEGLRRRLWDPLTRTLHHRWRDGERDRIQLLDAYAFLLEGTVHLYEATLSAAALEFACALADAMIERFFDPEHGGFYQSAGATELILRLKEDYDGAEPSGNSVATLALLRLAAITGRAAYHTAAERTLRCLADRLHSAPTAVPYLLLALDYWLAEPSRLVIAGDPGAASAQALLHAAHSVYQPNKAVMGQGGPVDPFALTLPAKEGAVAYLCTGSTCQAPTRDPAAVRQGLAQSGDAPQM